MFDRRRDHAIHAYDRIIGLDLSEVSLDCSQHRAPCGREGTGKNPTDRAKLGWKWSIATDAHGIPIGWAINGAHRNDIKMLLPTLDDVARSGLLEEIETLHLDRGYDYPKIRTQLADRGLDDLNIQRRAKPGDSGLIHPPFSYGALSATRRPETCGPGREGRPIRAVSGGEPSCAPGPMKRLSQVPNIQRSAARS